MHANLAGSIPSTLGQEGPDTLLRVDAAARGCAISFLTSDSSASPDCFLSFFFGITTHDGTTVRGKAVHLRTVPVFFDSLSKNGYVPISTVFAVAGSPLRYNRGLSFFTREELWLLKEYPRSFRRQA